MIFYKGTTFYYYLYSFLVFFHWTHRFFLVPHPILTQVLDRSKGILNKKQHKIYIKNVVPKVTPVDLLSDLIILALGRFGTPLINPVHPKVTSISLYKTN